MSRRARRQTSRLSPLHVLLYAVLTSVALPANTAPAAPTGCCRSDPQGGAQHSGAPPSADQQADKVQREREVLRQAGAEFKEGRLEEALEKCRQAIDLYPQAADAYYLLGMIQDRRGAHEEARQAMLRSLKLDPSVMAPHIYLGRMYLR